MSAAVWDQWNDSQVSRYPHEAVVHFVERNFADPVSPGSWALDLGCGIGVEARFLMERGFKVMGVDHSPIGLARTQTLVADLPGTLEVQQARLSQIDLPARRYSCAICVGVLEAAGVDEARVAVPRLADSLKPGGKALLVIAAEGDSRLKAHPELQLHGFSRREVEALIVLEYGVGVWIDTHTTTYQNASTRRSDWLVTIAKR